MSAHKLRVLLVVAVVAVVLALWTTRVQRPLEEVGAGDAMLPGLLERLDRVSAMSASGGSGSDLDIELADDVWVVRQRFGYPADMQKLREYLLKLAEARLVEPKTANPGNYAQLGVEDPSPEDAGGVLLTLRGLEPDVSIIIGRYNGQGSGTFVRAPGDAQSWLTQADLTVDRDPTRWLRRDIVDVPSSQVRAVTLVHGDGETIRTGKAEESASLFEVADVPAGRELSSEFVASGLAGFLAALRLDNVLPAAGTEVPDSAIRLEYETFDGRRFDMRIWDDDGRYLLSLDASMLPAPELADADPIETTSEEAADGDADAEAEVDAEAERAAVLALAAERRARAEAEIAALNEIAGRFVFQIPAFKWSAINKRMDDLLKPAGD